MNNNLLQLIIFTYKYLIMHTFKYLYAIRIPLIVRELEKKQVNNYHNMTDNTRDDGFSSKICIPIQTSFLSSPSLPSSLPISPILHKSEKQIIDIYTLGTNY